MEIKDYLKNLKINFIVHEHPAVYTVEEAEKYHKGSFLHCKNLFLKDKKSKGFYLVILPATEKVDLNELGEKLVEKLKFANKQDLADILGIKTGAVGPFSLINDKKKLVKVIIFEEVWNSDKLGFHPNINTQTLEISREDFRKYIKSLGNDFEII